MWEKLRATFSSEALCPFVHERLKTFRRHVVDATQKNLNPLTGIRNEDKEPLLSLDLWERRPLHAGRVTHEACVHRSTTIEPVPAVVRSTPCLKKASKSDTKCSICVAVFPASRPLSSSTGSSINANSVQQHQPLGRDFTCATTCQRKPNECATSSQTSDCVQLSIVSLLLVKSSQYHERLSCIPTSASMP